MSKRTELISGTCYSGALIVYNILQTIKDVSDIRANGV